jgi:hypothetical protein
MARSARTPADPSREERKTILVLGGVAAALAIAVVGLAVWLQFGPSHPAHGVSVAIAPLKDEIEPIASRPHPTAASQGPTAPGAGPAAGNTGEKHTVAASAAVQPGPAPAPGKPAGPAAAPTGAPPKAAAPPQVAATPQPKPGQSPATPATVPSNGTLILNPPSPPSKSGAISEHALSAAPDPGLIEHGKYGFEPVIGHDGRMPWQVYARPFPLNDPRPRIAIIVTGLGIGSTATDAAINKLPPGVTLAFAPFSRRISEWTNLARLAGHEVLLELPMEPVDYPRQDPGYNALLIANSTEQNLDRLDWSLSQTVGYVGLIGRMGSRFQAARDSLAPVLQNVAQRGLLFIDNRAAAESTVGAIAAADKLPYAAASRVIDAKPDGTTIVRNLTDLEDIARRNHVALGLISAEPGAIDRLVSWAAGLQSHGLMLAPVSAIAAVPPPPPVSKTATAGPAPAFSDAPAAKKAAP